VHDLDDLLLCPTTAPWMPHTAAAPLTQPHHSLLHPTVGAHGAASDSGAPTAPNKDAVELPVAPTALSEDAVGLPVAPPPPHLHDAAVAPLQLLPAPWIEGRRPLGGPPG
jgi:hypothetical protein